MEYNYQPDGNEKKPIMKHWWFWAVIVVIGLGAIVSIFGGGETAEKGSTPSASFTETQQPVEATPSSKPTPTPTPAPTPTPTPAPTPLATVMPTATPTPTAEPVEAMVWISENGQHYHSKSSCSGMKDPWQIPLSEAQARNIPPCGKCW